jgi:glycosyltransferase involved in cell wall biosynthesis
MDFKRKFFFIASYGSKKKHLNGESVKSRDVLSCLKEHDKVSAFNLDTLKYWNTFRFYVSTFFNRHRYVMVCKAPTGAKIILKYLKLIHYPQELIFTYIYGFGLTGEYAGKVFPADLEYCHALIVESPEVKQQFPADFGARIGVFPCLKRIYVIPNDRPYQHKDVLKLLFFSRIVKSKGVIEILNATIKANQQQVHFDLSIAGAVTNEQSTNKTIQEAATKYPFIHFLGSSFTIQGEDSYKRFSTYDLHVFPSQYFHECAPGSIVDSFIAGVPTLSSKFHSYEEMLAPSFAYFNEKATADSLAMSLTQIYENQPLLWSKRKLCSLQAKKYSYDAFLAFFEKLIP